MSIKDITVVITSFNSGETIELCLNSIDKLCKVIVVENSNNSKFQKDIEEKFSNVECILTGDNFGYGKANNIGLKKTKTKYALILNPDTTLHPLTIDNFLEIIKKIPDFALIGPYIQGQEKDNNEKNLNPKLVKNIKGFAMFLNIEQFKDVGFFDENFFIYFEEIDLCKRLIDNKKKIYLVPEIQIKHLGAQSHNKNINYAMELSRNWHWMWSTFYYHKKYNGFLISFLIIMPKLLSSLFKVIFYSLLFNKKKNIYYQRLSGLINAIVGKDSWYRPKI